MTADVAAELHTIIDLIRYGASRFNAAGLTFGHSYDNALDEASHLVLHTLHLPPDLGPAYGQARVTAEAAMAKMTATESAQQVIDAAVQIWGGCGVVSNHPVERLYREIRALRIYEGATEVQQLIIARQTLKAYEEG